MTAVATLLAGIRATSAGLTDLCPEHLRQSIRHIQRNCDIDCNVHDDESTWDDCKQPDRYDGDRMARALASIPRLVAAIEALAALHKPETRWLPYDGADVSYATREEAIEACQDLDIGIAATVLVPFDLCAHCKVIEEAPCEGECTKEAGYRESLWPCPTIAAVTAALGGGE